MPANSTPSLPTSPSPPRKTFSSQHNVWNKLLFRAERRAPQIESHLFLPRDPGDDHLRASFEDYLINHQLQIDAVFRIPVREPARPKRKAAKRCRPRQSTSEAQTSRAPSITRIDADDDEFDVVLVEEVPASALPSMNGSDDYVVKRKTAIEPSESGSDIPLSQRLRNDRALYSEASAKPSLLILPQQPAPERSRRRVSKSTPLSTMHNPLSSLEPSEDSPTLYSCDSRAVASRIESTPDVLVEDSSLDVVPVVSSPEMKAESRGAKRDSSKSNGRDRVKRTKHDCGDLALQILCLDSSSGEDEMSKCKAAVTGPRRSKRTVNACSSSEDDFARSEGIKTNSNLAKRDSKNLNGRRILKRAKIGSDVDEPLPEMDLFSFSNDDNAESEGGSKARLLKHNSKKPKDRGSLERTRFSSKADKSLGELDIFLYSEDAVALSKGRSKSERGKRISKNPKHCENLERIKIGSQTDAPIQELDLFHYSEDHLHDDVVVSEGRSTHRHVKLDSENSERRGSLQQATIGSEVDVSLPQVDLCSAREGDLVEFEAKGTKAKRAGRDSINPKSRETLNGIEHGSKRDMPLRVISLSSSSEGDLSQPESVACHRSRYAFRKSAESIMPTHANGVEDQDSSESGIIPLPPDCETICGSPHETPTSNFCQANGGKGDPEAASKRRDEGGVLRPPKYRRIGSAMENKRVKSKNSSSPIRTEGRRTSRTGRKKHRPRNLLKRSKNNRGKIEMDLQSKETRDNENRNIYSQVTRESQVRSNGYADTDALTSEVEIDGSGGGEIFGNAEDPTIPISSDCDQEGSLKDRCSPWDGDIAENRPLQRPSTMSAPPHSGKKNRLAIPLTLRIKQPGAADIHPDVEKRRRTCGIGRNKKSKSDLKQELGKKASKGQIGKRRSHLEKSMPRDKTICHSSPPQARVPMRISEDTASCNEFNASVPHQRYPLRSCKQGSERSSDPPTTRRAAKHGIQKPYNFEWSPLKTAAATNTTNSCDPSCDAEFDAMPSSELLHANSNEVREFERRHSSDDVEVRPKRLCSGKTSPSKGPHRTAKADISPKQSSLSRKWKRDTVSARSRRRARGENSSKRFGFSGSDIAFPPLGPLRKRGRGKGAKLFG